MGAFAPVVPPGPRGMGARAQRGGQGHPERVREPDPRSPARKRGPTGPQLHKRGRGRSVPTWTRSKTPWRRDRAGLPRTFRMTTGGLGESRPTFAARRHWESRDGPLERRKASVGPGRGAAHGAPSQREMPGIPSPRGPDSKRSRRLFEILGVVRTGLDGVDLMNWELWRVRREARLVIGNVVSADSESPAGMCLPDAKNWRSWRRGESPDMCRST